MSDNKYEFNPTRCKEAIEGLSKIVYDNSYTAIPTRDKVLLGVILDDLILDIEALHTAAQERDELIEAFSDVAYAPSVLGTGISLISPDVIWGVLDSYTDDEGELRLIANLDL